MKKSKDNPAQIPLSDKIADRIANWILKYQDILTKKLSGRTNHWSIKQQWIFLFLICVILGGGSILAMVQSFNSSAESGRVTGTMSSNVQALPKEVKAIITKEEFEAAKQYKAAHPGLIREIPDLYDRLSLIEEVYYSQKNK